MAILRRFLDRPTFRARGSLRRRWITPTPTGTSPATYPSAVLYPPFYPQGD